MVPMADYDNHNEDLTERYLLNLLSEEETADFQARMLHDARLRREVQVMRTLQKSLIAERLPVKKTNRLLRNKDLLLGLAVVLTGLFVYLYVESGKKASENKPAPQSPQIPVQQAPRENTPSNTAPGTPLPQKPSAPIAANLAPNPALERYINSNVRGGTDHLDITMTGRRFTRKNGKIFFRISGTLDAEGETPAYQVNVLIFSNKKEDYENSRPEWTHRPAFSNVNGRFEFDVAENVALHPGLCYYLVEQRESGEVLKVGKFIVE